MAKHSTPAMKAYFRLAGTINEINRKLSKADTIRTTRCPKKAPKTHFTFQNAFYGKKGSSDSAIDVIDTRIVIVK